MNKKICLLALVIVLGAILLTGCFTKNPITAEEFKTSMEGMGYSIIDATAQFPSGAVEKVYAAVEKDQKYQIEFFEHANVIDAVSSYNTNVTTMENSKGGMSSSTTFTGQNYSKSTQTSNGTYWVVSRVDNTFIFIKVSEEFKSDVNSVLDKLGY